MQCEGNYLLEMQLNYASSIRRAVAPPTLVIQNSSMVPPTATPRERGVHCI